mgnify:CR=1 FL=1
MVDTTIVNGHAYLTTGTISGNIITHDAGELIDIWFTNLKYDYQDNLRIIAGVITKGDTGKEKPAKIVDLKRITEHVTITGYLADEDGSSAKTKRNNLLILASSKNLDITDRELTLVWGTNTASDEQTIMSPISTKRGVFISKITFIETGGYAGEAVSTTADINPPERKLEIVITLVRGKDI